VTDVDLLRFINREKSPQPHTVTTAYGRLIAVLREASDSKACQLVLNEHLADISRWITTGVVDGINAAAALFVCHSLLAANQALGREGGLRISGFVLQLSMSPLQWAEALKVMSAGRENGGEDDQDVLRLDRFPTAVLDFLFKRGESDILREIFHGARQALDTAARQAMSNAKDYDSWSVDLAVMAAYLTLRKWLPLMIPLEDDGAARPTGRIELSKAANGDLAGGRFIPPPEQENPVLVHLFPREEIDALHRKEAYAAECFAHLYTAVMSGDISPEHQKKVADEYARRVAISKLDARQWLALGKSRFEIAPYIS